MNSLKRIFILIICFTVFIGINRSLVKKISERRKIIKQESGLFLLSPQIEKLVSLDYEGIRSFFLTLDLRVFLGTILEEHKYFPSWVGDVVYKAYKVVSALNPKYFDIYYISGLSLMWDFNRYKDAEEVWKRAIKNRPEDWRFYFYLSFEYFYFLHDYKLAALYMKKVSELRKSVFVSTLASRLYYASGRTEIAIAVLKEQMKHIRDPKWRRVLEKRKKALEGVLIIERALERYRRDKGRVPESIGELVFSGYLERIPEDPYGGKYYIDKDGKVKSTSNFVEKHESEKSENP